MQATNAAMKAYEEQVVKHDRETVVGLWDLDLFVVPSTQSEPPFLAL